MPEILKNHGFIKLGSWVKSHHATVSHLRAECPFGINYDIPKEWQTKRNVIYAFVVKSVVCYIGETTAGMASRFIGYRYGNPLVTDTDNRVKLAVTRALMAGDEIEIWAGQPLARLVLSNGTDLEMPASKPLEEYLIAVLSPTLNVKSIGDGNPTSAA
jgi:hypothetical protein